MPRWTIESLNGAAQREGLKLRTGGELPLPTPGRHCALAEEPPLFAWIEERALVEMCKARRAARRRLWLVRVSFLTRRGWTAQSDVRVRAMAIAGAAWQGVREAKRRAVPPRARVASMRVEVVPVPARGTATRE